MKNFTRLFTLLTVVVFAIPSFSQHESTMDRAIEDCSIIMQMTADISSDIQKIVAFSARGESPLDKKQLRQFLKLTESKFYKLENYSSDLVRVLAKHKKYYKLARELERQVYEMGKYWRKFYATVDKGSDSATISLGASLRNQLSSVKGLAQEIRKGLRKY